MKYDLDYFLWQHIWLGYLAVPACAGRFALQTTIGNNRLTCLRRQVLSSSEFLAIRKPINL